MNDEIGNRMKEQKVEVLEKNTRVIYGNSNR